MIRELDPLPGSRIIHTEKIDVNLSEQSAHVASVGAEDPLVRVLVQKFGLKEFRKGQRPVIESALKGNDTLAVMPTGGGKSLCYQLPASVLGELVIVISPLIALMQDQVRSLKAMGLRAGCLNSTQTIDEKRQVFSELKSGGAYLLFLSPERVQKPGFADWLRSQKIALFAVDEAHCVSQWGPDFRQDYAKLTLLRELKPDVPILALTATATPQVLDDITRSLGLHDPSRHVYGFYRPNLFYQVTVCENEDEKFSMIKAALRATPRGRALIYCGTRQGTEAVAAELAREFESVGYYHAGLGTEARMQTQRDLDTGKLRILAATNAFGMGIDYPDVRLVVHFNMTANIESFYQEMGRAGRDGEFSRCLLLYAKKDKGLQTFFIQQSKAEPRVISSKWRALEAMTLFAEGGECRHAGILTYFRDTDRIRKCGHCDICAPNSEWIVVRPKSEVHAVPRVRRRKATAPSRAESLSAPGSELRAEVLREWRKKYAEENDIAAFIVFSNKTLVDLAEKNPATLGELARIYGFGPHKLQAIGSQILDVLRDCD